MKARDLVIIGGGGGGPVVASVVAQPGLKVTLLEKATKLGGDCLHYGCVPSKTLIHAARVASLMRRSAEFGLPACEPEVDLVWPETVQPRDPADGSCHGLGASGTRHARLHRRVPA